MTNGQPQKPFLVRNFGNDREYDTIDELVTGLRDHYLDVSVAIHVRTANGMISCLFVDVGQDGELWESYSPSGRVPVPLDKIAKAAL